MLNSFVSTEECEVQIDEEFKKLEINWSNFKKSCLTTIAIRPPADQIREMEEEELAAKENEYNKLVTRRRQRLDKYEVRMFTTPKREANIGKLHVTIPDDGDFPTFGLSPPMHSPVDDEKQRLYEEKEAERKQGKLQAEAEIARLQQLLQNGQASSLTPIPQATAVANNQASNQQSQPSESTTMMTMLQWMREERAAAAAEAERKQAAKAAERAAAAAEAERQRAAAVAEAERQRAAAAAEAERKRAAKAAGRAAAAAEADKQRAEAEKQRAAAAAEAEKQREVTAEERRALLEELTARRERRDEPKKKSTKL